MNYALIIAQDRLFDPSGAFTYRFFEGLLMAVLTVCLYIAMTAEYLNQNLKQQANYDQLTHTINRHAFLPLAEHVLEQRKREFTPVSLMMMDLDNFKTINDTYGHSIGDDVLQHVAAALIKALRTQDVLCRYGGEEFIALCPNTNSKDATMIAERLRAQVESLRIARQNIIISPTISIGLTTYPSNIDHHNLDLLIETSDKAMYKAKTNGRNRVESTSISEITLPLA